MASHGAEILGEVVIEVWGLMSDNGLWKAKYKTREAAIKALDSKTLQEIRLAAQKRRDRKPPLIKTILDYWGEEMDDWVGTDLGEKYLDYMATISSRFRFQDAKKMRALAHIEKSDALALLSEAPPDDDDLDALEISLLELSTPGRTSDDNPRPNKRRRYKRYVVVSDDETDEIAGSTGEEESAEMIASGEEKSSDSDGADTEGDKDEQGALE
ncbi:hypothetical protein ABVK25_008536 [Lepraria finkii]|uniref:Uncharacterized protein n=1 Tax=Lepraria finkii TaxID=1340010 RepID=A0ABR4B245_9LECA